MKKFFCFILSIVISYNVFGQKVSIENIGVKDYIYVYVRKTINNNIPDTTCNYNFVLIQEGNSITIKYNVSPYNIEGSERTDNIKDELGPTIKRICDNIGFEISRQKSYSDNTRQDMNVSGNTNYSQPGNYNEQRSQSNVQQPTQQYNQQGQQYNQPAQQYNQPAQQNNNGGSFSGWATNTFGKAYSDDVVKNIRLNEYSVADVYNGAAQVGGLVRFADGSKGIIFYLDGQGHGVAVSLDQAELKWQEVAKTKYCQDIYQLPNEKTFALYCNAGLGRQQSSAIYQQLGYQAPSVSWCMSHGEGWYLPSAGELWYLLSVANANKGQAGVISLMIQAAGGTPINEKWYWSSSEEDNENAHNISSFGTKATESKTSKNAVRAVKAF